MDNKDIQQQINNLEKRVTALEAFIVDIKRANRTDTREKQGKIMPKVEYPGPKGGILLLIQEGFLKTRRTTDEVWTTIEKKGYAYKRDVVQTALNRLSKPTGPLVKMEGEGKKVYVERK